MFIPGSIQPVRFGPGRTEQLKIFIRPVTNVLIQFELIKYEELSLRCGYPDHLVHKILERRARAYILKGNHLLRHR